MLGLSFNLLRCKGSENQASTVVASISLLRNRALPSLLPTASPPSTLSSLPSHSFPRSPQAISHGFLSVHLIITSISLAPSQRCSPNLFPTPSSPSPCRRFHLAPSQRSSPQAISYGFPSVHHIVASISLLPNGALLELFPMHSFLSVHLVVASISLLPNAALPNLFPMFWEKQQLWWGMLPSWHGKGRTVRAMTRLCDSLHSILITTQRFNATCIFKLELARKPQLSLKRSFKALAHQIKKTWGHWWRTPGGCAGP